MLPGYLGNTTSCGTCSITWINCFELMVCSFLGGFFSRILTFVFLFCFSSSYSSDALDFEIEHKIDPVFDSPRMSRRSLRLAAAGFNKPDSARNDLLHDSSYAGNVTFRDQSSK